MMATCWRHEVVLQGDGRGVVVRGSTLRAKASLAVQAALARKAAAVVNTKAVAEGEKGPSHLVEARL